MSELDLGTLRGHVDLDVQAFDRKYGQVDQLLDELARRKIPDVRVDADTVRAEQNLDAVETAMRQVDGETAEATVLADASRAESEIGTAQRSLQGIDGDTAEMRVDADTSPAESALDDLGDEGEAAGQDAGAGLSDGIKGALMALPVAGAVVLAGAAIGKALLDGMKDGLSIEVGRDLFSARTGLDEATAARFARAAGESYANAFGDSVDANLDTARHALQQGLIDENATQAEIQAVVDQLTGITDVFEYDVPAAARGVGQLLKTGLVQDAEDAFDLITRASQGVMSDDLMDTLNEYASQFETVGLTAEDAFGLIRQGLEAGARDTDKVADAVKEMGLRIREGTDPAREALANLGVDVEGVIEGFQRGGPQARDAMQVVFDALRETRDEGGNVQEVIANLFGGPGEDLGAALFALDLETAQAALGETEGAARDLLATLGDNAATQIESAQRNIEVAADGIKGALASAFSDELGGAADWVSRNRGPVMEFLLDAANGIFDFGRATVEAAAVATEAFGDFVSTTVPPVLDGIAQAVIGMAQLTDNAELFREGVILQGKSNEFREFGDTTEEVADQMRESWGGALGDMQDRMNEWAAPEIMAAHVHDAVMEMQGRVDEFSAHVDASGGTVTINGDAMTAEEALQHTVEQIDASGGYVTIDGQTVPADQALDALMAAIDRSEGDVTVDGDTREAHSAVAAALADFNNRSATLDVYADTSHFRGTLDQVLWEYDGRTVTTYQRMVRQGQAEFQTGGYTGDLPVDAVAGVVHGSEFVIDAANTAEWRPLLEAIHNDTLSPADLSRGAAPQLVGVGTSSGGAVSLDGGHITGTLMVGGDGLAQLVDARINFADSGSRRHARMAGV